MFHRPGLNVPKAEVVKDTKQEQLNLVKRSTQEYLHAYNNVVVLLWRVNRELAEFKEKKHAENKSVTKQVELLSREKKYLEQCLERNKPMDLIKKNLAEIVKLEEELHPERKIDLSSPYSFSIGKK